jgi:hypothetical protein
VSFTTEDRGKTAERPGTPITKDLSEEATEKEDLEKIEENPKNNIVFHCSHVFS